MIFSTKCFNCPIGQYIDTPAVTDLLFKFREQSHGPRLLILLSCGGIVDRTYARQYDNSIDPSNVGCPEFYKFGSYCAYDKSIGCDHRKASVGLADEKKQILEELTALVEKP